MGGLSYQAGTENRYRYNGKEFHQELDLGLYDYGARMYDPAVGRWNGVDLLAENYQNYSPFNYVLNNPINWLDPNGMNVSGNDTAEYKLDPVVITASRSDKSSSPTIRSSFYARLHLRGNSFGNSHGVATVDYRDVRNFNNELSNLPYGLGLAYSLTAGSFLDFSVGMGEIFDEGDLGSGGLKLAALIPLGKGGVLLERVGGKWVVAKYGAKGTDLARNLGKVGEEAVGAIGSKLRIPSLTGTAKFRIPDGLTSTTLSEVKYVKNLSLTRQVKDYYLYSKDKGLQFILYTRTNTTFSKPLQNLIDLGEITIRPIKGK